MERWRAELLVCGWRGHFLVGADAARLEEEDAAFARDRDGVRWLRCLRCDAWQPVPLPATPAGEGPLAREEIELPLRGQALRDRLVLRLIALDRAFHFVVLVGLAVAVFALVGHQSELRQSFFRVVADLEGNLRGPAISSHGFVHELDHVLSLQSGNLDRLAWLMLGYGLLEGAEGIGLWFGRRWAEYLTFVATSLLLPLEVHELALRVSVLKIVAFVINVAVVLYLIWAKRLFGVRGGGREVERARAADNGWQAIDRTSPETIARRDSVPG